MHMRWASIPKNGDDFSPFGSGNVTVESLNAPSPFDAPSYNWLGNPFSSAVNPVFWKLHGWVDSIVGAWLKANGYARVARECAGAKDCYEWRSHWVGDAPHGHLKQPPPVRATPADPLLGKSLQKILPRAGFRNPAFDEFLQPKVGAPPRAPAAPDPTIEFADPAVFVQRFGPCS